jgi:hypothetical protein
MNDTHACTYMPQPLCYTTYVLYCCTCNCHDEIVRQPPSQGIAGASRSEELASVVQEGSFLSVFCSRVASTSSSSCPSTIVAMRFTWCCRRRRRRRRRCGCWRLCLLLTLPRPKLRSKTGLSNPQQTRQVHDPNPHRDRLAGQVR